MGAVRLGDNDLKTRYPIIAKEWHPSKNGELKPEGVSYGSRKRVWWLCPKGHSYDMAVCKRTLRGSNCPICSGHRTESGTNDFATVYPEIAKEWHPTKNGKLTPDLFGINSNESAWWMCKKCGHEWKTLIIHRAGKRNSGCPECAKIKKGETFTKNKAIERGSLAEKKPELLKQWAYDLNPVLPSEIAVNYNKKVWWRCEVCGYEWEASPNNRNKGVGCPCCSGRVPEIGENDLKTVNPNLVKEWDYSRNEKEPEQYKPNSGKKAWWTCSCCGHNWEAEIRSRNRGHGCPKCSRLKRK